MHYRSTEVSTNHSIVKHNIAFHSGDATAHLNGFFVIDVSDADVEDNLVDYMYIGEGAGNVTVIGNTALHLIAQSDSDAVVRFGPANELALLHYCTKTNTDVSCFRADAL